MTQQTKPASTPESQPSDDDVMIRLAAAPAEVEALTGERPNIATIYRWKQHGLKGVRLRTAFAGGHRRTTRTWIREFFAAVTAAVDGNAPVATQSASEQKPNRRAANYAQAERVLDAIGA